MKKSINQLKIELKEIAEAHLQVNSFYWGDIIDATHQTAIQYPLMNCYYPNGSFNFNTSVVQIVIEVGDKLYKDSSNLNDVESDTLQMIRDVYQIINKSVRWKTFGKVQNATYNKFKWSTADEIAGHRLTVNFALRDSSGVCDLPLIGYDYDGDVPDGGCPSVTVINSDMSFDVDVTAGDILQLADITYDIKNSEGTTIVSGSEVAQSNVAATAPDITITDSDGLPVVFPSGKNFVCIPAAVCADASYLVQYDNLTPIQSGTVASGGSVTVNVPDPVSAVNRSTAKLMKTGAVSNVAGDDGSTQVGRATDWITLDAAPLHDDGSTTINTTTFRFTDEFGGQTFTSGIILDWSTWDGSTVLGWQNSFLLNGGAGVYTSYAVAKTFISTFTLGGFSGWKMANFTELFSVAKKQSAPFNYAPFSYSAVNLLWCDTTLTAGVGITLRTDTFTIAQPGLAGNSGRALPCRNFLLSTLNVLT